MTSEPVPPTIPLKLQRAGYRFIRILPGSKDPMDKAYPTVNNYLADEKQIQMWLNHDHSFELKDRNNPDYYVHFEGYGNYGVLCSDTLIAIDLDRKDIIDVALQHPLLKDALSGQSGSGEGLHIWVQTDEARTTRLNDPETGENVGHIKAKGGYVVGPGCLHPSGGLYHIVNDGEIPFIPFKDILSHFSKYAEKKEPVRQTEHVEHYYRSGNFTLDIPIERIWYPLKAVKAGSEIQGEHPLHGSKGGKNFSINTRKNVWRCWRCNSGGGAAEAIAVSHGLMDCSDALPGCWSGKRELFTQVLDIAEDEYGWTRPIKTAPAKPRILPDLNNDINFDLDIFDKPGLKTDTLPEKLPDAEAILVDGYPRIGKTHWSEIQAIEHGTANIIANTHSVIDQHMRIFSEHRHKGQTAVHLEGRERCCRLKEEGRRSCDGCQYYPYTSDPADRGRFLAHVYDILHSEEIVTKETAPDEDCPYFFTKEAAKIADFVYTVPDNLEEITGETHQKRHLTVIDEDTCFARFFPQSADLAEFVRGPTRNYVVNLVETKWVGIQKWKDYIVNGKKRPKGKKTILKMIEILEDIREILRIKDDVVFSPSEILHNVSLVDLTIPEPEDITKPELIREIERWEIPDTFSVFARALLYPYKEKTLDWQGYNPMKLRLIADEEQRIYDPPNTKMILIGSTRAEMFLKTLDVKYEAIRINKFKYSRNFLFFVVKGTSWHNGKAKHRRYKDIIKTTLKRVANTNSTSRYPLMILVGTKKEQNTLIEELGGICKGSSDENIKGQKWNYISGCFNIFYQNSVISRGVDIPFYKTLIAYSSDFANPYWTARKKVAFENKDNDDYEYAEAIIDAITVDETTNSILRITPVVGHTDTTPRTVIIGEKDLWKIKPGVLEEATVVEVEADQLFINIEKVLDVAGRLELLPEKEDVDSDGRTTIHWYADTIFDEPPSMIGKGVEEKSAILKGMIVSNGKRDPDAWRKNYRPATITAAEDAILSYLVKREQDGKSIRFDSLRDYMTKRNKQFKPTLITDVIMGLYRSDKIRIDNMAKDHMRSIVRIATVLSGNPPVDENA